MNAFQQNQKMQESLASMGQKITVETTRWIGDKQAVYLETLADKGKTSYYYLPVGPVVYRFFINGFDGNLEYLNSKVEEAIANHKNR